MAFTTSNLKKSSVGNMNQLLGQWTGAVGDTDGTVTLKGGKLYEANFLIQDGDQGDDSPVPVTISESSGTITVTVHNRATVTNGRLKILWK